MRIVLKVASLVVTAVLVQPALGTCQTGNLVVSCFGECAYITSPGQSTPASATGDFWALGAGDAALGLGADGGTSLAQTSWLREYAGFLYVAATWANAGVDGCIDDPGVPTPKRTVVAITDSDAPGPSSKGYVGVLCKESDQSYNYFLQHLGPTTLVPIPRPTITMAVRGPEPGQTTLTISSPAPALSGSVLADPSCTGLIRGYKIFTQTRGINETPPSDRRRDSGWIQVGGERPLDATSTFVLLCGGPQYEYLALGLVFESGFETAHVSQNTLAIGCWRTMADRPREFRLVPKRSPSRQRE